MHGAFQRQIAACASAHDNSTPPRIRRAVLAGNAFVFTLEPGAAVGALGGGRNGYIPLNGANVIGVRDAALGWQFYVRTSSDAPFPAPVSGPH